MSEFQGCPGSRAFQFNAPDSGAAAETVGEIQSQLRQWPIQLHLVSPNAPYYQGADVLLTADCVAYALGDFHSAHLKGKALAIACPKLDQGQEVYREKIKAWLEEAQIKSLTILIMQVPCCMGLLHLAEQALQDAEGKVPVTYKVIGVQGEILQEETLEVTSQIAVG
jgi:hypothetical protein